MPIYINIVNFQFCRAAHIGSMAHLAMLVTTPTEPHKTEQKTTKACHKGIKKLRFLDDFGVSIYYQEKGLEAKNIALNLELSQSRCINLFNNMIK